ncbi:N-6 DNA methylase [Cohnella lubricantis]|uniref:site-specific DNA-methyltransferase (adenine-specific) n=1 Tax=Cohnella lubricantis TaxID=2163172 RepID=A0A841T2R8_9BACL|nr:N-6 DNA methylase [Cohnella lubricantis]MBB6675873.1 N-6 DNA methylase [Cohnella lubricantis]MBP2117211.1 type I restriction-modification system DNA methylase subunit [Cohnella lubricantis]
MIEKCQVFTPAQNVIELLDNVGYITELYGKKVVENACGDGNILKEIVRRYIEDSLNKMKSIDEIKHGLESDVYGVEIDAIHHQTCIKNLNEISSLYGINNVRWNVMNLDFLKQNMKDKFDYVIGNPPYITYRDLDDQTRNYVKENYTSCKYGKFDYCYAFIEASLSCLNSTGKLAYLIPNSIFKNVFAKELRKLILPHVTKIIDYTRLKLFQQALTSSAILICNKGEISKDIEYRDVVKGVNYTLPKNKLEDKWKFTDEFQKLNTPKRFGDFFSASISIATLLNRAYILKNYIEKEDYIIVGNHRIERGLVRKGVSPRTLNSEVSELILFPYKFEGNDLVRYGKEEFENTFPEATRYLKSFEKQLSNRKSDKSTKWFEYGRTQALAHLNQPKLLLSIVVTNKVKVYEVSKESIPYSGIYIVPKKDLPLEKAKEILESDLFYKYVQEIGINASGNSIRITVNDVNNYQF